MTGRADFVGKFIRWVTDGFVVVYGLWTLLCHVAVGAGRSFSFVAGFSFLVPLAAALILFLLARPRRRETDDSCEKAPADEEILSRFPHAAGLAGAALLVAFYALSRSYVLFWAAACLFLGFFYIGHLRSAALRLSAPQPRRSEGAVFFALVLAAAALVLVLHRPDHDDSFFLSIPVQALENPDGPLFQRNVVTDTSPRPIQPTYYVHSVELASGMLARLFGTRPITAAHMILPVLFAVVFVCAAARLMRLLLGGSWLFGLTALFFLLLFNGDVHWSYGNFGLVRFFQGKAFLASGMVPLLAAYSLEYMSGEKRDSWTLLFAGQVASLGLNSAGLYVGPVVVGLSLLGAWRPEKRATLRFFPGALTAAYPLAIGLLLRLGPMRDSPAFLETYKSVPAVTDSLDKVFGTGVFLWFWLLALLGGWAVFRDASRRRWVLGFALAFAFLFLNPFLNVFWARNLMGIETKWRILWALPLPVWLAIFLAALSGSAAAVFGRTGKRGVALAAILLLFGVFVPSRWTISTANQTQVRWPSWKVPLDDYRLAEEAAGLTDPGRFLLAPEAISVWVPTITRRVFPLVSREFSINFLRRRTFSFEEREKIDQRLALFRYVSGISRDQPGEVLRELLRRAVAENQIQTVIISRRNPWRNEIELDLRGQGFKPQALSSRKYLAYRKPSSRSG
ncbi:MAG: hypothetical protein A2Y86_02405 [Candidatus Aminicenantes bacterium RBG_13_62_12]|nr:MAG: hypothetical protein A2Y86_02405 [Candidatus Aminicenantes bacterium RBG_13_62_12]